MSFILFLMGVAALILGFFVKADTTFEDIHPEGDPDGVIDAFFMMATGVIVALTLFISICGCFTGYLKNKMCLCCYGILALLITMILLAYGAMVLLIKSAGDGLCAAVNDEAVMNEATFYEKYMYEMVEDTVVEIDQTIAATIDSNMCTEICPCYRGENDANYDIYMALTETEVNKFGRTLETEDVLDPEAIDGETVLYSKLVWEEERADEYAQYISYTSLFECAEDLDKKAEDA